MADEYESLPENVPASIHMVAGALAGITEHTVTYPIDSIKTRMQIIRPHPTAIYRSTLHALSEISSREGLPRLWRGVGSVVLGAGPAHALYFATYERVKEKLVVGEAAKDLTAVGVAGACATAASDAFMTPFDVVKQRMQVHGSTGTVWSCARNIMRQEGPSGFFVSYPTTLILNVPFHMIQFPVYEACRALLNTENQYSPAAHIIAGGVAGGTAAFCTTPIDVIKTTLQTRNLAGERLNGTRAAIAYILKERGPTAFLMGAVPRTLTFIPGTAVCWAVYEYFKWHLQPLNKSQ
jgi:solute carrier family 25 iron transporter 28/37